MKNNLGYLGFIIGKFKLERTCNSLDLTTLWFRLAFLVEEHIEETQ